MFKQILLALSLSIPASLFAQETVENRQLLWSVKSSDGEQKGYLFGTIHVSNSKAFAFNDTLYDLIKSSEFLALELDPASPNLSGLMDMIKTTESLDSWMNEEDYQKLDSLCMARLGMGIFFFNKVKPFFTASMLAEPEGMVGKEQTFLDFSLGAFADSNRVEVFGLETAAEQLAAVDSLPQDFQRKMLLDVIHEKEANNGMLAHSMDDMLEHYINGDTASLLAGIFEEDIPEEFNTWLLVERNKRMTERSISKMKEGVVFVAVGAAHLYREYGLIQGLRAKGYVVENIPLTYQIDTENN